ncbi:MAG TPA: SWIM zinc finger family protein [Bradyrhizobium sp.]|nr:SWIM zinc finger family protein [Bradyrhizobium sp.]
MAITASTTACSRSCSWVGAFGNRTPESFARGRSYFDDSAVSDLVRRGDRLTAEVEGSELAPYRVSIRLHDGGVTEARCSCPYDLGGYCKHIVAVLLKFADEGTRAIERKPLAKLLRELDQSRLIELLEKRAESDSELAAWMEAELATTVEPSSLHNKEVGRRRTPVDGYLASSGGDRAKFGVNCLSRRVVVENGTGEADRRLPRTGYRP